MATTTNIPTQTLEYPERRPYPHGWDYDSTGRLHLSWIWRAPGTLPADNFDIMYAYSDDEGATWYNSAGQLACTVSDGIGMHLSNNPPVKVMNYPEGTGLLNGQNRQCVDSHGRLHILQWNGSKRFTCIQTALEYGPSNCYQR